MESKKYEVINRNRTKMQPSGKTLKKERKTFGEKIDSKNLNKSFMISDFECKAKKKKKNMKSI